MNIIRWLHLSDFHVGKSNYGGRRLFTYILTHIDERIDRHGDESSLHATQKRGDKFHAGLVG